MRNVINNHRYDTELDKLLGSWNNGKFFNGIPEIAGDYYSEELYVNGGGFYYLHIIAGVTAQKFYSGSSTDFTGGSHGYGCWIKPVTKEYAESWLKGHPAK